MNSGWRFAVALSVGLGSDGCAEQDPPECSCAPPPCMLSDEPLPFDGSSPFGTPHALHDELGVMLLQLNDVKGDEHLELDWQVLSRRPSRVNWELVGHGEGLVQPSNTVSCEARLGVQVSIRMVSEDPPLVAQFEGVAWSDGSAWSDGTRILKFQGEMSEETFANSALADLLRREAPQLPLRAKRVALALPVSVRRLNGEDGRLTLVDPGDDPSAGEDPSILAQIDTGLGRPQEALRRLAPTPARHSRASVRTVE